MTLVVDDADFRLHQGDVRCPCGCDATFSPFGSRGRERRYFSPACSPRVNRVSGGGVCERCCSSEALHMHHVKPWASHPELRTELDNLVLLCRDCHINEHRRGVRHQ